MFDSIWIISTDFAPVVRGLFDSLSITKAFSEISLLDKNFDKPKPIPNKNTNPAQAKAGVNRKCSNIFDFQSNTLANVLADLLVLFACATFSFV
jgi:hypothetical protein